MRAAAWLLIATALARPAMADVEGGGSLALDLHYARDDREVPLQVVSGGARARAAFGARLFGLAAGLDFHLGASTDGNFAYGVSVLPLGAALMVGRTMRVGVVGGFGLSGVSGGALPVAFALPVEVFTELSLGSRVRAAAWGRAAWLFGAERRESGAADAPFGDELETGLVLRWDRRRFHHGFSTGNGYHLGATFAQRAGADVIGVVLGYSLDAVRQR